MNMKNDIWTYRCWVKEATNRKYIWCDFKTGQMSEFWEQVDVMIGRENWGCLVDYLFTCMLFSPYNRSSSCIPWLMYFPVFMSDGILFFFFKRNEYILFFPIFLRVKISNYFSSGTVFTTLRAQSLEPEFPGSSPELLCANHVTLGKVTDIFVLHIPQLKWKS